MVARNKVVISGSINAGGSAGTDQWSVGFHYGIGGGLVEGGGALTQWANDIAVLFEDSLFAVTLKSALTSRAAITKISCYQYDASGPAVAVGEQVMNVPGVSTANKPAQCAVVASLNTGLAGRSFRGRAYWPMLGYAFANATLTLEAGTCQALANDLAETLDAISNAAVDPTPALAVYSATQDLMTPVNSISVGNVVDTQRRRRSDLVETRFATEYPPA